MNLVYHICICKFSASCLSFCCCRISRWPPCSWACLWSHRSNAPSLNASTLCTTVWTATWCGAMKMAGARAAAAVAARGVTILTRKNRFTMTTRCALTLTLTLKNRETACPRTWAATVGCTSSSCTCRPRGNCRSDRRRSCSTPARVPSGWA